MQKTNKGFTLMEVVLAIAVLSLGLLAVSKLFSASLARTFANRDEIIAAGLAQEGVELIRNMRDSNAMADPDNPFANITTSPCNVDFVTQSCSTTHTSLVYSSDRYTRSNSTSKFHRIITAQISGDYMTVRSYVSWDGSDPETTNTTCVPAPPGECTYAEAVLSKWQ